MGATKLRDLVPAPGVKGKPGSVAVGSQPQAVARRLRQALEMFEIGVAMMRQRLRRDNPSATEAHIARMVNEWLLRP